MLVTAILVAFCALIGFSVTSTIMSIGKSRAPVTPGVAVAVLFIGVLEVAALAYLAAQP